jgi:tyrosine decarboxylase/aspartate 1-decarboxylase
MALDEKGSDESTVINELNSILEMDITGFSGHPIASMSTIPHKLGAEVFSKIMERNAGRLHSFRSSARVEEEVIEMIADLLHLNRPSNLLRPELTGNSRQTLASSRREYQRIQ